LIHAIANAANVMAMSAQLLQRRLPRGDGRGDPAACADALVAAADQLRGLLAELTAVLGHAPPAKLSGRNPDA
jgi:hypothetical protein